MNDFDILTELGKGSFGCVYKVRRKTDSRIYALKKVKLTNLSSKEKQNALNEVRILASVKSTFVISYKEAFIDDKDQSLCIVMEYADKGDLYQKITQFKKITLSYILLLFRLLFFLSFLGIILFLFFNSGSNIFRSFDIAAVF